MDAFIKVRKQKKTEVVGRSNVVATVMKYVESGETLCIHGSCGVGKTYLVNSLVNGVDLVNGIDLDFLAQSSSDVIVDNIDIESGLWKEVTNRKKLSKGCTLIITSSIKNIDFCDCLELKPLSEYHQLEIVSQKYPNICDKPFVLDCIKRANGNLRDLFYYLEKSDDKDIFMSPKDYIHKLLTEPGVCSICENVDDHGYSWGVVHENYSDAKNIDYVSVIDDLSMADVYDAQIYNGNWELLPFFCHHGIVKPCTEINGTLYKECIRPGSAWTKFNNYKMRKAKMSEITNRSGRRIDVETLLLIRTICIKDPDRAVELMVSYGMKPQDVDIMNHIALETKIKPKAIQFIKKNLKNVLGE